MALGRSPPTQPRVSPDGPRHVSTVSALPISGESIQVDRPAGWGAVGGRTLAAISREEVIAFGGIQDPVSAGRRMSGRLQGQQGVDDMQLRCTMRAAKLRDIEVTTGMSVNIPIQYCIFLMMRLFIMQIS